jgi:hypothetical protein
LKSYTPFKIHCYVDASYAVCQGGKGTCSAVTLGKGSLVNVVVSKIKNIQVVVVGNCSTEFEVVGISNSLGGKYRHIEIRYFFMKDRPSGKFVYINSGNKLKNFFTKPIQGELFRK